MPTDRSPASRHERERFPSLQETIGEDPARFLDRPLFDGSQHTSAPGMFIRARVRGIDRIEVVRAWIAIERRLERGPRERVIEMLEEREEHLREIGERPDRLERVEHDRESADWYWIDQDGERIPWSEIDRRGATIPDRAGSQPVATDGGDHRGE